MLNLICQEPGCGGQIDYIKRYVPNDRIVLGSSSRYLFAVCMKCGKLIGKPPTGFREETLAENEAFVLYCEEIAKREQEYANQYRRLFEERKAREKAV